MKSLTALAACCAIGLPVAFGETFTYTWDGTSESYGDGRVAVGYAGDAVATLTAKVAEGDTVVFEGETPVSLAADATVKVDGRGSLTFSNDVAAAGALVFTSDAPRLSFNIDDLGLPHSTLSAGGPEVLAVPGVMNLADYVRSAQNSAIQYNGSTRRGNFASHCPVRTADSYAYQIQNWYSTAAQPKTMCILLKFIQRDDGVALTNAASWAVYGYDAVGEDFLVIPDKGAESYQILETSLVAERVAGRREVTFAGAFSSGGALTIAGGVSVRGTAKAFGTENGATFDRAVGFDSGSLTFLESWNFTNAATLSGTDGDIFYETPDLSAEDLVEETKTLEFPGGLGAANVVALPNADLRSVLGLTMKAEWRDYAGNSATVISVKTNNNDKVAFTDDLPPMYFEKDPWSGALAVARFQTISMLRTISMSVPLVLEQVGGDVAIRAVSGVSAWHSHWPNGEPKDVMTWDPWVGERTGEPAAYTVNKNFYVTNVVIRYSSPAAAKGPVSAAVAIATQKSGTVTAVNTSIRPGAFRYLTATITTSVGTSGGAMYHVYDRANLRLGGGSSFNWSLGLWNDNTSSVPDITVHPGGRAQTYLQKSNPVCQVLNLDGSEYRFTSSFPVPAYANGKLKSADFTQGTAFFNYIGGIAYSDGAVTTGLMPYIGSSYNTKPVVSVRGATPCRADNGFHVVATSPKTGEPLAPVTLTFDVADVTGSAEIDFTSAKFATSSDCKDCVTYVKTGDGTMLLSAVNVMSENPFEVAGGTLALGCSGCLGETAKMALTGGSLAVAAGTTNTLESIAIGADTTLTLGDGATLAVTDPTAEWATDVTVNIVGDPKTCTLKFGDETGSLSSRQFRRIRWNGEKCHVAEDGTVVPGALGIVLIVR